MYPVLLKIGPFEIQSYGTAVILAFLALLIISARRARRFRLHPQMTLHLAVILILVWVLGARFGFVLMHSDLFQGNWSAVVNPFQGTRYGHIGISGWIAGGGHLLAFLTLFLYGKIKKVGFMTLSHVLLPGFLFANGVWRIGCFLNGCCFGLPTESAVGVEYPVPWYLSNTYSLGTAVWSVQLFEAAVGFSSFGLFVWLERRSWFPGDPLWLVVAYWSLGRTLTDQFRHYRQPLVLGSIGPLTFNINHLIFGGIFLTSLIFWLRSWLRSSKKSIMNI